MNGSPLSLQQQQQDYYHQANKSMSPTPYSAMSDPHIGLFCLIRTFLYIISFILAPSISRQYSHLNQTISGDRSTPGNFSFDDERITPMSTSFDSSFASVPPPAQFVPNPAGIGPRSVPKRSTFIRTRHVDASNEDLTHDQQQQQQQQQQHQQHQQQDSVYSSSKLHAPQAIRHLSNSRTRTPSSRSGNNFNIRPPLIHGALDSRNSSGHDSGLSSGGASFDPEQHHMYNLTNPSNTIRSNTPTMDVYNVPPPVPVPKRKSLPSIVKTSPGAYKIDETARSSDNLKEKETFIIENGIRKRVTAQAPEYTESGSLVPQASVMTSSSGSPILARRVILESVTKLDIPSSTTSHTGGNKRGSMPTVVNIARHRQEAPSKFIFLN